MIDKLKSMGPNNGPAQVVEQAKTLFIISAKERLTICIAGERRCCCRPRIGRGNDVKAEQHEGIFIELRDSA